MLNMSRIVKLYKGRIRYTLTELHIIEPYHTFVTKSDFNEYESKGSYVHADIEHVIRILRWEGYSEEKPKDFPV